MRTIHKAAATALIVIVLILLVHVMYTNIVAELKQREQEENQTTTTQNNRIILVVNKTIEEWKRIYRDYILYSDRMVREGKLVTGKYNLLQLLSIIDHANSSTITRKFYFYDDIIHRYVVLEIIIPEFVIELHLNNMPEWGSEPIIKAIATTLRKYVEEYPSNYTEYRLALMILSIASQIHYKWEPRSYDALLEIVYDEGNCMTKSGLAIELAADAGLWVAYITAKACPANGFPADHAYVAIAIDNPPPRLKGCFNFTWKNHIFYLAELSAGYEPEFPIKPYPCSEVENIIAPYYKKLYDIGRPLW